MILDYWSSLVSIVCNHILCTKYSVRNLKQVFWHSSIILVFFVAKLLVYSPNCQMEAKHWLQYFFIKNVYICTILYNFFRIFVQFRITKTKLFIIELINKKNNSKLNKKKSLTSTPQISINFI